MYTTTSCGLSNFLRTAGKPAFHLGIVGEKMSKVDPRAAALAATPLAHRARGGGLRPATTGGLESSGGTRTNGPSMRSVPDQKPADGPRRLGELLGRVFSRIGLRRDLDDYRIWQAWDEVVGPLVARNAQPIRLDGQRLVVAVRSTTWMQELSLLRHDLCSRLNRWMSRDVITDILLVVGKIEPQASAGGPAAAEKLRARNTPSRRTLGSPSLTREQDHKASPEETRARLEAAIEKLWSAARNDTATKLR
jgi:predicted nucleic acid-binding Zn ribbon protein